MKIFPFEAYKLSELGYGPKKEFAIPKICQ